MPLSTRQSRKATTPGDGLGTLKNRHRLIHMFCSSVAVKPDDQLVRLFKSRPGARSSSGSNCSQNDIYEATPHGNVEFNLNFFLIVYSDFFYYKRVYWLNILYICGINIWDWPQRQASMALRIRISAAKFFCGQNRCIDRIFVKLENSQSKFSFVGKKYTSRRAEIG